MKRTAMADLVEWKGNPSKKPLLVFGARQVGKSYLIEEFAKANYENYVILDLEAHKNLHAAFEDDLSPTSILSKLEHIMGLPVRLKNALIVLDEIQVCDGALTSLKYFQEQAPQCHVIGAGSLLGAAVRKKSQSMPVGKVDILTLHPMSFEEFVVAVGSGGMLEGIRESYETKSKYALHDRAMELFWTYLLVGGMPEAVRKYAETGSLNDRTPIHQAILSMYLGDMAKYVDSPSEIARIRDVWESVPGQLAKENRKFQYNKVAKGGRASKYESALDWLVAAGLITKCVRIASGTVPIRLQEDAAAFKVYMNDTGLLSTTAGVPAGALYDERSRALLDNGGIVENYVMQQMVARGMPIHYWESKGKAELDLVVEDGSVKSVPVEIKSSENVRSRSLNEYGEKYGSDRLVRFSTKNFGTGKVESIPLYAAGCFADDLVASRVAANGGR